MFRTEVTPEKSEHKIDHSSQIVMLGSCFSTEMAERLEKRLFRVVHNPFGQLYNPATIAATLQRAAHRRTFTPDDLFVNGSIYSSFDCHSSLSTDDRQAMINNLNSQLDKLVAALQANDFTFLTLGTAWVYRLKDTGLPVANCHKQHPTMFNRTLLSIDECINELRTCCETIHSLSPKAKIVFTVSPIRHLADGAHGNQISKSTLLMAIDRIVNEIAYAAYFPSYEIMMDDLRDYRFYAKDMTHVSDLAADYIFDRFAETFFTQPTIRLADQCLRLIRRIDHRPLTADKISYDAFREQTKSKAIELKDQNPQLKEVIDSILQRI